MIKRTRYVRIDKDVGLRSQVRTSGDSYDHFTELSIVVLIYECGFCSLMSGPLGFTKNFRI